MLNVPPLLITMVACLSPVLLLYSMEAPSHRFSVARSPTVIAAFAQSMPVRVTLLSVRLLPRFRGMALFLEPAELYTPKLPRLEASSVQSISVRDCWSVMSL